MGAEVSESERDSILNSVQSKRRKKNSRNNDGASMVQYTRDLVRVTEQDDYDNSGSDSYDDDYKSRNNAPKKSYRDSRDSSFDSRND